MIITIITVDVVVVYVVSALSRRWCLLILNVWGGWHHLIEKIIRVIEGETMFKLLIVQIVSRIDHMEGYHMVWVYLAWQIHRWMLIMLSSLLLCINIESSTWVLKIKTILQANARHILRFVSISSDLMTTHPWIEIVFSEILYWWIINIDQITILKVKSLEDLSQFIRCFNKIFLPIQNSVFLHNNDSLLF